MQVVPIHEYAEKVLDRFNMGEAFPVATPAYPSINAALFDVANQSATGVVPRFPF